MINIPSPCSILSPSSEASSVIFRGPISDWEWVEGEAEERWEEERVGESEGEGGSIISGVSSMGGRARSGCLGMVGGGQVETCVCGREGIHIASSCNVSYTQ